MATEAEGCDFCVIGGGIAGLSVAAALAGRHRVLLLEREAALAGHATGRSAALYAPAYGNRVVRALTRASRPLLAAGEDGDSDSVLAPRGELLVARGDQLDSLERLAAELGATGQSVRRLDGAAARARVPVLAPGIVAGLFDPAAQDIDTAALVERYRRRFAARGGELRRSAEVVAIESSAGAWRIVTATFTVACAVVVNAAGAWADAIAALAGVAPLGLRPLRRSAATVELPAGVDARRWPCVIDADEQFYFKPDAGRLLLSAADEVPSPPVDASPDDLDIATAVDRVERATCLEITRIASRWAGLRTFAPDRSPVIGFELAAAGFFWLAGQGGYGLQTAPAAAACAAALARGEPLPQWVAGEGVSAADLAPARLRNGDIPGLAAAK